METVLRSSLVRIIAATAVAVVLAIIVWRIAERPKTADDAALAPASNPPGAATENTAPPSDQAAARPEAPPVTQTLPTEPDTALANSGPPAEVTTPQPAEAPTPPTAEGAAAPAPVPPPPVESSSAPAAPESTQLAPTADAPKFANAVPDKAPPRTSEPRAKVAKPAPPHRAKTSDQTVLHVRRLQTQLLVGALSCGRPHMQSNYNTFVAKFDRALKINGQQLKAYFTRTFGARGVSEMDAFLTKLSNELSLVSMRQGEFCDRTDGLFNSVLALPTSEIDAFADRYLTQPVVARDGF